MRTESGLPRRCRAGSHPSDNLHYLPVRPHLIVGLGLGISYAITAVVALIAIVQPNHVTTGLAALNWVLLLDAIATLIVGTVIWFFTLKERATYHAKWLVTSPAIKTAIQDQFSCCGYFTTNETDIPFGGFCTDQTFASNQTACVGPLVEYADFTLNNIFTCVPDSRAQFS